MSIHQTRHVDAEDGMVRAECLVCGWAGQAWATPIGAENEAEFHRQHPQLTGENEAIDPQEADRG